MLLSRGSVLRTSPPACILLCPWHFLVWNAKGIAVKNPDKNLSGKRDEREVKICKNQFFTLHSSFFIFPSLRFHRAKRKLWPRQRPCFIAPNITFHTTKHNLSRCETLPLANSYFVNYPITNQYPCNHLSVNALPKTAKIAVFLTEWPFRCQHPPFFGVKIRIFLDKFPLCWIRNSTAMSRAFAMPNRRGCQRHQIGAVSKKMPMGRLQWGCQRHQTKVASHTETPLGVSNQRSLFAKRGKVNGWYGIAPII